MNATATKTINTPMPSGGGSYIREADGSLKPAPTKPQSRPPKSAGARSKPAKGNKPTLKEGA